MTASQNYHTRPLNPKRKEAIEQFAGQSVLDVGCGNGSYVLHFAKVKDISGVDSKSSPNWQEQPDLFSIHDAHLDDYPSSSFDTITAFELLEHVTNPAAVLKEFNRVARSNIIITVPNCDQTPGMKRSGVVYNHYIDSSHVNFWKLESIIDLVNSSGFKVQYAQLINCINLEPLIAEALNSSIIINRFLSKVFSKLINRDYPATILIVANCIKK